MDAMVIVGAGQAGAHAAQLLRVEGWKGQILLIGEEKHPPYERPPLSKGFLTGEVDEDRLYFRREGFYAERGIELITGTRVEAIEPKARRVRLRDGRLITYHKLLLATGAKPRRLDVPCAGLAGILTLRTLDDSRRMAQSLTAGSRVAIVGGGYIGLEVAAAAVKAGASVTVLEAAPRLMARVVSEPLSEFYAAEHRARGVDVRLGAMVEAFEPLAEDPARVGFVRLKGGERIGCDIAVLGVGVEPLDALARAAGIACDDGVLVDEVCRSSDPDIFAAGDVARQPNPLFRRSLRLESVQNAIVQAKVAAQAMLGRFEPARDVPWFWSDQYDLKLQIAGVGGTEDRIVVRGNPAERKFSILRFAGDRLVAVESIGVVKDILMAKRLIAEGRRLDVTRAADPLVPLAETAQP